LSMHAATSAPTRVCQFCRQFEAQSGPYLDRLLDADAVTLVAAAVAQITG